MAHLKWLVTALSKLKYKKKICSSYANHFKYASNVKCWTHFPSGACYSHIIKFRIFQHTHEKHRASMIDNTKNVLNCRSTTHCVCMWNISSNMRQIFCNACSNISSNLWIMRHNSDGRKPYSKHQRFGRIASSIVKSIQHILSHRPFAMRLSGDSSRQWLHRSVDVVHLNRLLIFSVSNNIKNATINCSKQ